MTSASAALPPGETMMLSIREVRMIVERILLSLHIPEGFVPAVRDCVLYSQIASLGGLAMLGRDCETLKQARPSALRIRDEGAVQVLDGSNQHAWIAAPSLLDLVLARARAGRGGEIVAENVAEPAELALLIDMAGRYGAKIDVNVSGGRATVRVVSDNGSNPDAAMIHALAHGTPVGKTLWAELYARSHDALTPDSIESRRHAGPVMVDAQGRVHGRDDDDTDFSLLGGSAPSPASENA
jgi:hypothetical protein